MISRSQAFASIDNNPGLGLFQWHFLTLFHLQIIL
jgi:hypothetical protein